MNETGGGVPLKSVGISRSWQKSKMAAVATVFANYDFWEGHPSSFIQWPSKKTKTLRNEPSLSTVTEVLQMTHVTQLLDLE